MINKIKSFNIFILNINIFILLFIGLTGCYGGNIRSIYSLNRSILNSSSSNQDPCITDKWLISLVKRNGKQKIEMFDLRKRVVISLPGVNTNDSQPISVSCSYDGNLLAFVRQRSDKTELLLYRRQLGSLQKVDFSPKGIPRRVSLDSSGKLLAVEVSREGRWEIDLIRFP